MPREKSPATPGIDPGTFRLVAQYLKHYANPDHLPTHKHTHTHTHIYIYIYIYIYYKLYTNGRKLQLFATFEFWTTNIEINDMDTT